MLIIIPAEKASRQLNDFEDRGSMRRPRIPPAKVPSTPATNVNNTAANIRIAFLSASLIISNVSRLIRCSLPVCPLSYSLVLVRTVFIPENFISKVKLNVKKTAISGIIK